MTCSAQLTTVVFPDSSIPEKQARTLIFIYPYGDKRSANNRTENICWHKRIVLIDERAPIVREFSKFDFELHL
jgi:hypothetical protein